MKQLFSNNLKKFFEEPPNDNNPIMIKSHIMHFNNESSHGVNCCAYYS